MSMLPAALAVLGLAAAAPTPLRLPAEVDDAYALDANPGGLGFLEGGELRVLYARDDLDFSPAAGGPTDGFGLYTAGRFGALSLGAAFDIDVDGLDRTGYRVALGTALRARALSLGLSLDHLRRPGSDDADTRFNLGLSYRVTSWLAAGVSVRDLAQTIDRRRWDLGLALRPFDWMVLSTRWRLTQSQPLNGDTYDIAGLLTVTPIEGLRIGAGVERSAALDWAVTGQLGVDFGRFGFGAAVLRADDRPGVVTELVFRGREHPNLLPRSGVAVVDVRGSLTPPPSVNLLSQRVRVSPYGDLPLLLAALARSDQVDGVFVRIGTIDAGWAKAREVRNGLLALRASGRRVDCQLGGAGDLPYYIASACTTILVPPPSVVQADGVAASLVFLGDLVDRAGLTPQVVRRGKYKSAPEQFTRNSVSAAQREALGAYLDDVYGELVGGIATGRKLPVETVEGLIDLAAHTSSQAVARKLVDQALYPDEVEGFLRQQYGRQPHLQPGAALAAAAKSTWGARPRIALVYVDATITGGDSADLPFGFGRTVGARTLSQTLEALRADPGVEAVVLRVDSPGGGSVASDLIARSVKRLNEVKPVIASFGDVAASGGYYVAAPARAIYAEPTTLTGSIGVFSLGVSAERLLTRIGVGVSQIERGRFSGSQTPLKDWSPEEKARVDELVEHFYQRFLQVVAEGRDMKVEAVHAVAQGRIWSGVDAQKVGLVDELGGFVEAIQRAKQEAGLAADAEVSLEVYPANRRPLPEPVRTLAESLGPAPAAALGAELRRLLPEGVARHVAALVASASADAPLALLPIGLEVD